ncbi:hypothetical protein OKHIL_64260 [Mycolicibacterium mageritense]
MPKLMRRLAYFVTAILLLMCWGWAYAAFRHGAYITVVIALALSVIPISIVAMTRISTAVAPGVAFDSAGTWLRPDPRIEALMHRLVTAGIVATATVCAAWLGGVLYQGFLDEFGHMVPLLCGVTSLVLLWTWWMTKRQGGISYLILSPDGFEFSGLLSPKVGKWDDIAAMVDDDPEAGRFWGLMDFTMTNNKRLRMESTGIYTPGGKALYEFVRFYWQHPEHRDELTNGRALNRLESLQV